jgi:hypothetical protein
MSFPPDLVDAGKAQRYDQFFYGTIISPNKQLMAERVALY